MGRRCGSRSRRHLGTLSDARVLIMRVVSRVRRPFLPFVTDEVWSWSNNGSIHRASWPSTDELRPFATNGDPDVLDAAATTIATVRKSKSDQKMSMRTAVSQLSVHAPATFLAALRPALDDVRAAGVITDIHLAVSGDPAFDVILDQETAAEHAARRT